MLLGIGKIFRINYNLSRRKSKFSLKKLYMYVKILIFFLVLTYAFLMYYYKLPKAIDLGLEKAYFNMTKKFGLTLENVYLEGQNYTDLNILVDSLNIETGQPILSISINDLKQKLQQISWVKHAIVERNYPNTLFIGIIEKNPMALWQKDNQFYLIDENGDIIKENKLDKFSNFIVVIGEDAPRHAKSVINIISKNNKLYKNISHIIRIGDRRWNIKFHNGMEIKLPEEHLDIAWNYVIDLFEKQNLFGRSVSMIDLRIPSKMYIR